jgi:hypothetical protein
VNRQVGEDRWVVEKKIAGKEVVMELGRDAIVGRVFLNTR